MAQRRTPTRRAFLGGMLGAGALATAGCGPLAAARKGGADLAGFAQKEMAFFFFVVEEAAVRRTVRRLGYDLQTTNAQGDANTQFQQCQTLLVKQPGFIVSDPVDSRALTPLTERARGVPFGVIDTPLSAGSVDITVAFDNRRGGRMAAQRTVELLRRRNGSARGTVLNVYGSLESFAYRERKIGFEEVLQRHPDITVLSRPSDSDESTARSVTEQTLSQYPDVDAMHTPSDSLTRGVLAGLRARGRALPRNAPEHVVLSTIDGEPQALDWLRDGVLDVVVSQDPIAYAEICVRLLHEHSVRGRPVPLGEFSDPRRYYWGSAPIVSSPTGPLCELPPFFIDESNVEDDRMWGNRVVREWGMSQ